MIMSQHRLRRSSRVTANTPSINVTEMTFISECFGSHAALSHSRSLVHVSKSNYCECFLNNECISEEIAAVLSTSGIGSNIFMGQFKVSLV